MATLLIDHVVHFQSAEGADLAFDSGSYSFEPAASEGLRLSKVNGKSSVIPATAAAHDERLALQSALAMGPAVLAQQATPAAELEALYGRLSLSAAGPGHGAPIPFPSGA